MNCSSCFGLIPPIFFAYVQIIGEKKGPQTSNLQFSWWNYVIPNTTGKLIIACSCGTAQLSTVEQLKKNARKTRQKKLIHRRLVSIYEKTLHTINTDQLWVLNRHSIKLDFVFSIFTFALKSNDLLISQCSVLLWQWFCSRVFFRIP